MDTKRIIVLGVAFVAACSAALIVRSMLGGGTPMFRAGTRQQYRQRDVRASSNAVHIIYERLTNE